MYLVTNIVLVITGLISLYVYITILISEKKQKIKDDDSEIIVNFIPEDTWEQDKPLSEKLLIGQYKNKNGTWSDSKLLYFCKKRWHVVDVDIIIDFNKFQNRPDRWSSIKNIQIDIHKEDL